MKREECGYGGHDVSADGGDADCRAPCDKN